MRLPGWLLLGFVAVPLAAAACAGSKNGAGDDTSTTPTPSGTGTTPSPTPSIDPSAPKYHEDVQPIVYNHCQSCHTTGGLAPAIDTYPVASTLSALMDQRTGDRSMPPWPPEPSCGQDYKNARLLSSADQDVIHRWYLGGSQEGNPANAPTPTPTPMPLPSPSVVDAGTDFTFGGASDPADRYECFRWIPGMSGDFTRAQITPGNKAIVHHIILYREPNGSSQPAGDMGQCGGVPSGGQFLVGWVPGAAPLEFPANVGMALAATDAIDVQIHYHNNGTPQTDHTTAALWFSPTPTAKHAVVVWTGNPLISIPPNTTKTLNDTCTVPNGATPTLLGVAPHMHQKGTKFHADLVQGSTSCLIDIAKWDFGWQGGYMYSTPKVLAGGNKITTSCTWFNDTNSTITFGEGTGNEMCFDFLYMVDWSGSTNCYN